MTNKELTQAFRIQFQEANPAKDAIKEAGFRFAGKKKAWYYRREEDACKWHGKKKMSLNDIRMKYGSQDVKTEAREAIA